MKHKPRIAILGDFPIGKVYDRYAATKSSCAGWLYNLYELFQTVEDFDFHWIVVDKAIDKEEEIIRGGQTFHLRKGTTLTVGLYTAYWYNRRKVAQCVKKIKPDIFHGWGTERFYGLAALDFKYASLLSVQGILSACGARSEISSFEKKQSWYEKYVFRGVNYITTESSWAKERVLELAPAADVTLWEYAPERLFFDLSRNLTQSPTCLLAGTHTPVKDIPTAVKAFSSPELSHVTLYLAGVDVGAIAELPSNIIPLGRLTREEMSEYLSKVWCLVHPSLADSSPNIVKEARVVGLPVVVTTECGGKQYIEHGKSGFVITPKDDNALVDAVINMTKSQEVAIEMGKYGNDICRTLLEYDTMKNTIVDLYHKILNA